MFYNYKIVTTLYNQVLYLYLNSYYEFSKELDSKIEKTSPKNKIDQYIHDMDIDFNGNKIMLIVNNIVIATIDNYKDNNLKYEELVDTNKIDNVDIIGVDHSIGYTSTHNNNYSVANYVIMKSDDIPPTYIDINEYIVNKLLNMIPVTYDLEAIKSAAIIVRTQVLKELVEDNYLDASQYNNKFKKIWNNSDSRSLDKYIKAIYLTDNQYLTNNSYYFGFNDTKYHIPYNAYNANILAKNGYSYVDILGHFFPNAHLHLSLPS